MNSSHRRALPPPGGAPRARWMHSSGCASSPSPPNPPRDRPRLLTRSPAPFTSPAGRVRRADGCGRRPRGPRGPAGAPRPPRPERIRAAASRRARARRRSAARARAECAAVLAGARAANPGRVAAPPPPHLPSTQLCAYFSTPLTSDPSFSPERRPGGSLARVHPSPLTLRAHSAYPQRTRDPPRNPSSPPALTSMRTDATTTRPSPRRPGRQLCRAAQLCRKNINETRRAPPRETIKTPTAPTTPPPTPTTPPPTPPPFTTPPPLPRGSASQLCSPKTASRLEAAAASRHRRRRRVPSLSAGAANPGAASTETGGAAPHGAAAGAKPPRRVRAVALEPRATATRERGPNPRRTNRPFSVAGARSAGSGPRTPRARPAAASSRRRRDPDPPSRKIRSDVRSARSRALLPGPFRRWWFPSPSRAKRGAKRAGDVRARRRRKSIRRSNRRPRSIARTPPRRLLPPDSPPRRLGSRVSTAP